VAGDDLLIRAAIRDEMSAPLHHITEELGRLRNTSEQAALAQAELGAAANKATQGLERTARSSGGFSRVLSVVTSSAMSVVTALGAVAGAATVMGLTMASSLEQSQIAFTTLLGSADAATGYMKGLKDLAAATPFQMKDVTQGAQRLIAMGFSADDARVALIAAGDAAASVGLGADGVNRITYAFGQMKAAGRLLGSEMRQLSEAGINGFQIIADATGQTYAQVRALSEKGALDAETYLPILINGVNAKVGGMMEKQAQTLSGLWSTLKDTVGFGLSDAINPSLPAIKDFIKQLTAAVGPLATTLGQIGIAMLPALLAVTHALLPLAPVVAQIAGLLGTSLAAAVVQLTPLITPLANALLQMLQQIAPVLPQILGPFIEATIALIPSLPALAGATVNFLNAITPLLNLLPPIASALNWLTSSTGFMTVALFALLTPAWLVEAAIGAVGIAVGILGAPVVAIIALIAALTAVVIYGYTHWAWMRTAVDATAGALKSVGAWIWDVFTKFTPLGLAVTHLGDIWWALTNPLEAARAGFERIYEWAMKAWDAAKKVGGWINPFGDTATSHATGTGSLGSTLAMHGALAGAGSGIQVSNALMGGGGVGRGSGDHQAGRALDLVGSGLNGYANRLRTAGGFAEFHGSGRGRHLHAVYPGAPAGDTLTTRAGRTSGGGGDTIILPPGAIVFHEASSEVDIEAGVRRGIEAYMRDRAERR
jgi:tape measure domain-containing protein